MPEQMWDAIKWVVILITTTGCIKYLLDYFLEDDDKGKDERKDKHE